MMSGIKGRNTSPELLVRKQLHALGFRYRIHCSHLPGKPDVVLPKHRVVIFIHGCFWHGHDCHLFKSPSTNVEFWENKISRNRQRDAEVLADLEHKGWRVLTVWECSIKGKNKVGVPSVVRLVAEWIVSKEMRGEISGT